MKRVLWLVTNTLLWEYSVIAIVSEGYWLETD